VCGSTDKWNPWSEQVALNLETRSGSPVEPPVVVRWRSCDYCGRMDIRHSVLGWEERAIVVEPIHDPFST
jgi:hypothetical protein